MANYELIRKRLTGFNIVGGALHPECIYLIAEEFYDEEKHGEGYDAFSFVGEFRICMYLPSMYNINREWGARCYTGMKKMRQIAVVPNKNIGFLGVFYDGDVIAQKSPLQGPNTFNWIEGAIRLLCSNRGQKKL